MMTSADRVGGWFKKGQNHDDVILEWSLTLTASFFETGAMATQTKSRNPTILGLGVPASSQWSHPSRFRHWQHW